MSIDVKREWVKGVAAGVPFVALPPATDRNFERAPLVVSWHLVDPPRTEAAMASALPLAGVPAWRVYFGLPMLGARTPVGGFDEVMRLGSEDFILKLFGPVVEQAAGEAPAAIEALRDQLPIGDGPIGVVGASMGSAVALLLLAEGTLPVIAGGLVSPVPQLAPMAGCFGPYTWTDESRDLAGRFDFVARAAEIAARQPQPAVLLAVGARDTEKVRGPATALRDALVGLYTNPERVGLVTVPEMAHALAEPPGIEPAPQTRDAERVDAVLTQWLSRHLDS